MSAPNQLPKELFSNTQKQTEVKVKPLFNGSLPVRKPRKK